MIKENSGKIYRFKLDHNQGYGFAEIYDFTDLYEFDGRIIYVYNLIEDKPKPKYDLDIIYKSGISIGPIRLMSFPGTRGKYASKYIGQRNDLLINEIPETKELNGIIIEKSNWNDFDKWYRSDNFENGEFKFIKYRVHRINFQANRKKEIEQLFFHHKSINYQCFLLRNYYYMKIKSIYNQYITLK